MTEVTLRKTSLLSQSFEALTSALEDVVPRIPPQNLKEIVEHMRRHDDTKLDVSQSCFHDFQAEVAEAGFDAKIVPKKKKRSADPANIAKVREIVREIDATTDELADIDGQVQAKRAKIEELEKELEELIR